MFKKYTAVAVLFTAVLFIAGWANNSTLMEVGKVQPPGKVLIAGQSSELKENDVNTVTVELETEDYYMKLISLIKERT